MLDDDDAQRALRVLRNDFRLLDAPGPRRAAEFIVRRSDDDIQADVVGAVGQLLAHLNA